MSSHYTLPFTQTSISIFLLLLSNSIPYSAAAGRPEKTTRLHFYFQDEVSGKNATAVQITGKGLGFGATFAVDNALTERPELNSDIVGRAQGMYSNTARNDSALLMAVTFVFTSGKYDGSSVSMLGRNRVFDRVREMPIVGGSGAFRMARGYALASTAWFDPETGNACVEYNVTVEHFDV
ncbi:dirigent protein 22-like [Andrographis paniculata]|uniref:dirigent protein 22-like n=1 Tax=Andrographis paniculata TaxID=175694 RepID=UPI0021E8959E|nr:dirigent protein 22-like [Andrographis paniculata]